MTSESARRENYVVALGKWFDAFMESLPDDNTKIVDYCTNTRIPIGSSEYRFSNPKRAAELIRQNYIPTPHPLDIVTHRNVLDECVIPLDRGFQYSHIVYKESKEMINLYNNIYGESNWTITGLKRGQDDSTSMGRLFVKKPVAVEKFELMKRFSRCPQILARLQQ